MIEWCFGRIHCVGLAPANLSSSPHATATVQDNIQNMTKYNDDMHKATATREALDQALEARAEAEQPREQDTVWLDNKAVNASRARSMLAQYASITPHRNLPVVLWCQHPS